jgi:hypothetical protein
VTRVTFEQHFGPDIYPDKVFAAIGRALCAWETMEFEFATLYTVFHGRKRSGNRWIRDSERLTEYGYKTTFETRMDMLMKAFNIYSVNILSQSAEARLKCILGSLIDKAKTLSSKRHQIAHSVLGISVRKGDKSWPGGGMGPPMYAIFAPMHLANSLIRKDKPTVPNDTPPWLYSYRINEIDGFAAEFNSLRDKIYELISELDPQS